MVLEDNAVPADPSGSVAGVPPSGGASGAGDPPLADPPSSDRPDSSESADAVTELELAIACTRKVRANQKTAQKAYNAAIRDCMTSAGEAANSDAAAVHDAALCKLHCHRACSSRC